MYLDYTEANSKMAGDLKGFGKKQSCLNRGTSPLFDGKDEKRNMKTLNKDG
jgi:hypothetical protein